MTNDTAVAMGALNDIMSATPGWLAKAQEVITVFGLKLIAAVAIFIVGRWVAKLVQKLICSSMKKANVAPELIGFASNLSFAIVMAAVVLASLAKLGVQTTSFVAVIGAAGLAVGLALQGSLSNFAAGVLIIILRPFKIGDYVEGGGTAGVVKEIHIFTTTLTTPDNKRVIVPNSSMISGNITNFSAEKTRRVDLIACISYDDNMKKAKELLTKIVESDERVLKDPAPTIAVSTMNDSSIDIVVRPWVNSADYWSVYFSLTEKIKDGIEEAGMSIPYPQQDVHLYKH